MKEMKNRFYNFKKIYIEKKYKGHVNVNRILSRLNKTSIEYVDNLFDLIKSKPVVYYPGDRSKVLFLGGIHGNILKKCPGSLGHICCNYYVINLYIGCPLNCTYCILQEYLNQPFIIINIDLENIFQSLNNTFKENKQFYRIGTGESGDSLAYDPITDFSIEFINFFSNYPENIFEFKTKTNFIDNIIKIDSPGNIVVGFSINPENIIENEEGCSSTLKERLEATRELVQKGYKVSFHFDPIINIIDFDKEYYNTIKKLFEYVSPTDIAWISLGSFRYPSDLKKAIEYNYPFTDILYEEFILCNDKKFRYLKSIRLNLYKKIISWLHDYDKNFLIYLCMESPEVWKNAIGYLPGKEEKLKLIFQKAVKK